MARRSAFLSHRLLANARSAVDATGITRDDTMLALLPFSHLFGLTVTASAPLLTGARVLTMPRFHPSRAAQLIALESVTAIVGVPAVFRALLAELDPAATDDIAAALRLCVCGGAPLDIELQNRWFDATGVELRQGYGLTEASPVCLFNRVDRLNVRGTLGTPFPGVDVRLADDDEILVRGENVFRGYVSGGDAGLPVRDGWLHTGDRGRLNADGGVAFAGLLKPMFTRNGFNIYPRELERVVRVPGVEAATVSAAENPGGEPGSCSACEARLGRRATVCRDARGLQALDVYYKSLLLGGPARRPHVFGGPRHARQMSLRRGAHPRLHDARIELGRRAARDLLHGHLERHLARTIRTVARHGVERIGRGGDARLERDRVPDQAVGDAAPVESLVV